MEMTTDVYNHVAAFSASSMASVPGTCEIERISPIRTDVNLPHVLEEILGKGILLAASLPPTEQHFQGRIGYGWTSTVAGSALQIVILLLVVVVFIII